MSVEEYLALEEASDRKHEYVGGEVYALAGATEPHNLIVTNLVVEAQLAARRGAQCRVLGSDMRLRVTSDVYYYPDLMNRLRTQRHRSPRQDQTLFAVRS